MWCTYVAILTSWPSPLESIYSSIWKHTSVGSTKSTNGLYSASYSVSFLEVSFKMPILFMISKMINHRLLVPLIWFIIMDSLRCGSFHSALSLSLRSRNHSLAFYKLISLIWFPRTKVRLLLSWQGFLQSKCGPSLVMNKN